jgi:K+/H+ antiporter YhaU regulatory subunit KhtT
LPRSFAARLLSLSPTPTFRVATGDTLVVVGICEVV